MSQVSFDRLRCEPLASVRAHFFFQSVLDKSLKFIATSSCDGRFCHCGIEDFDVKFAFCANL